MKKPSDWCSVAAAISVLGGRWKPLILHELSVGTLRFNELLRRIPDASHQVLTSHLRQLESDGIIERRVLHSTQPHVEYSLTQFGMHAMPALHLLDHWGREYLRRSTHPEPGPDSQSES